MLKGIECSPEDKNHKYYSDYIQKNSTGCRLNFYAGHFEDIGTTLKVIIGNRETFKKNLIPNMVQIYRAWHAYILEHNNLDYSVLNDRLNEILTLRYQDTDLKLDLMQKTFEEIDEFSTTPVEIKLVYLSLLVIFYPYFFKKEYTNKKGKEKAKNIEDFPFAAWKFLPLFVDHDISLNPLKTIADDSFVRGDVVDDIERILDQNNILFVKGKIGNGTETFIRKVFEKKSPSFDVAFNLEADENKPLLVLLDAVFAKYFRPEKKMDAIEEFFGDESFIKLVVIHKYNDASNSDIKKISEWKESKVVITSNCDLDKMISPDFAFQRYETPDFQLSELRDIFWYNTILSRSDEEEINQKIDSMIEAVKGNAHLVKAIAQDCNTSITDYYNQHFANKRIANSTMDDFVWKLFNFSKVGKGEKIALLELISADKNLYLSKNDWEKFFSDYKNIEKLEEKGWIKLREHGDKVAFEVDSLLSDFGEYKRVQGIKSDVWLRFIKKLSVGKFSYEPKYAEILDVIFYKRIIPGQYLDEHYAELMYTLGDYYENRTEIAKGIYYYEQAVDTYNDLIKNDSSYKKNYYAALNAYGFLCTYSRTTFTEAISALEEAVDGRNLIFENDPCDENKDVLATSLDNLSYVIRKTDFVQAFNYVVKALNYRFELILTNVDKYIEKFAWSCDNFGSLIDGHKVTGTQTHTIKSFVGRIYDFCEDLKLRNTKDISRIRTADLAVLKDSINKQEYTDFFLNVACIFRVNPNQKAFTHNNIGISHLGEAMSISNFKLGLELTNRSECIDGKATLYNNLGVSMLLGTVKLNYAFRRVLYYLYDNYKDDKYIVDYVTRYYTLYDNYTPEDMLNAFEELLLFFKDKEIPPVQIDTITGGIGSNNSSQILDGINKNLELVYKTLFDYCNSVEKYFLGKVAKLESLRNLYYAIKSFKEVSDSSHVEFLYKRYREFFKEANSFLNKLRNVILAYEIARQIDVDASPAFFIKKALGDYRYMNAWNDNAFRAEELTCLSNLGCCFLSEGNFVEARRIFNEVYDGYLLFSPDKSLLFLEDIGDVNFNQTELNILETNITKARYLDMWGECDDLIRIKKKFVKDRHVNALISEFLEGNNMILYSLSGARTKAIFFEKGFYMGPRDGKKRE